MKLNLNTRYCFLCVLKALLLLALFSALTSSQIRAQQTFDKKDDAKESAKKGVVFKTPDKFMRAELSGFKGTMFLNPDKPSGIFITYPNENESIEDLTKRARAWFVTFFVRDKKKEISWQLRPVKPHSTDKAANVHLYESPEMNVQVIVYEREVNGLTFIYGYFAMRNSKGDGRYSGADFLNDEGKGVKAFEKFQKSIEAGNKS